ncbi:MAG: trypsin-like peptidase domain-containing protein [Pseudomonadota bacterium]
MIARLFSPSHHVLLNAVATLVLIAIAGPMSGTAHARAACLAPQAVCDVRAQVFRIESFDPFSSAVRIGPDLLVTSRHAIADETTVKVFVKADGSTNPEHVTGLVVPTTFAGDLVLVRAALPDGPSATLASAPLAKDARLHTVGYDVGQRRIRVYLDGSVLALPDPKHPLARLHHTAHTQPGNSGGALVDEAGQVVGIVASGGAGIFEAVPAASIAALRAQSDLRHALASKKRGMSYRACALATETVMRIRGKIPVRYSTALEHDCLETGNRQMIALAGQAFGRARDFSTSERLFRAALAMDPNALNTRLGLATTQLFARKPQKALPHVRLLLTRMPDNLTVQRMAVQAGKQADDKALVATALDAIKQYNPQGLAAAERFLRAPLRRQ